MNEFGFLLLSFLGLVPEPSGQVAQAGEGGSAGPSVQSVPDRRRASSVGNGRRTVATSEPVHPSGLQPEETVRRGQFGCVPLPDARWRARASVGLLQPVPQVGVR